MKRLTATFVLLSTATFISVACGSGDSGKLGQSTCSTGDTRPCTGPGACSGGQVCGKDGSWGTCDCGGGTGGGTGSGGIGGAGGASGSSGAGGTAGEPGDAGIGGMDGSATGGSAGSFGGAAGAAGASSDDPCPPGGVDFDCSGQCSPLASECMQVCGPGAVGILIKSRSDFPIVLRTPPMPGANATCTDQCQQPNTVWGLAVFTTFNNGDAQHGLLVHVQPPYYVLPTSSGDFCLGAGPQYQSCYAGKADVYAGVSIVTDDPDAPARNVYIEDPFQPTCP